MRYKMSSKNIFFIPVNYPLVRETKLAEIKSYSKLAKDWLFRLGKIDQEI